MPEPSPHSFIRRVVEMAFRQVSWLGPWWRRGLLAHLGAMAYITSLPILFHWGLTVAVTTRDSHPLPYSLAAQFSFSGSEHLKAITKNCSRLP